MSAQIPEMVEKLVLDGTKVGWYPDRIAAWKRGERVAPITIDCAMTRACNAACSWCYAQLQASESEGKVTRRHFLDFLSDAAEIGVKGTSFISDGESTVVPWFADAVEHATKVGLATGTSTNGIKLSRPILERILPCLSYLRFNFPAGDRKRYAEIMGVPQHNYDDVIENIRDAMEIVNRDRLPVTVNMSMVCDPRDGDQILPFAELVCRLRPAYGIIKHCADDVTGALGVDYSMYPALIPMMDRAEEMGKAAGVRIAVKRSKLGGTRRYTCCYGAQFIMQVSGNGLVAPCGYLFNEKYKAFHIGNITKQRFKDIWLSDRYMEVFGYLAGKEFNPQTRCGPNCLQHSTNAYLFEYANGRISLPTTPMPAHPEFI